MRTKHLLAVCAALPLFPGMIAAQTVSATITTATPIVVSASSAMFSQSNSVPANTVGPSQVNAFAFSAEANSEWYGYANSYEARVGWVQTVSVGGAAPSFADTGANELLVQLQATGSVPVVVEIASSLLGSTGASVPSFGIDLFDDGSFDVTNQGPATFTTSLVLGPQPIAIRLKSQLSQVGPGNLSVGLTVRVRPDNGLSVSPVVGGCGSQGELYASPVFDGRGVEFTVLTASPVVLVLGLSPQPVVLPTSCLLMPSPDLLVPIGLLPGGFVSTAQLAIPAAARPLTLWAQGVVVSSGGLATTTGYAIPAW